MDWEHAHAAGTVRSMVGGESMAPATHFTGTAMGPSGKWIDGINPDASVVDAARLSLAARLTAVAHWLPLAAYHADQDVEHVHRLRVSTRRAVAALRLYRDWLPGKKRRRVKRQLKKIRRAAGAARDLDVLANRIECEFAERSAPLLADTKELRAAAQPAVIEVAEKCRCNDRFVRRIGKLLDGIGPRREQAQLKQSPRFCEWAAEQLARTAGPFFDAVPAADADTAALHQFRIRAKALRYAIELLAPAFSPELREVVYPQIEELQERLGQVQDCVTGAAHLRDRSRKAESAQVRALVDELAERKRERLSRLVVDFRDWWTAERVESIRAGLQSHGNAVLRPGDAASRPVNAESQDGESSPVSPSLERATIQNDSSQ